MLRDSTAWSPAQKEVDQVSVEIKKIKWSNNFFWTWKYWLPKSWLILPWEEVKSEIFLDKFIKIMLFYQYINIFRQEPLVLPQLGAPDLRDPPDLLGLLVHHQLDLQDLLQLDLQQVSAWTLQLIWQPWWLLFNKWNLNIVFK